MKGFWEYFECGVHVSFDQTQERLPDMDDMMENYPQRSNLFLGCLSAANGLRHAFVLVQISRFQQIIGVYTLQAPSETAKVGGARAEDERAVGPVSFCYICVSYNSAFQFHVM